MKDSFESSQVIHLGKKSKKEIKKYKQGFGAMHMEVQHVLGQVKTQAGDQSVLPIVVVHKAKKKKGILAKGARVFDF